MGSERTGLSRAIGNQLWMMEVPSAVSSTRTTRADHVSGCRLQATTRPWTGGVNRFSPITHTCRVLRGWVHSPSIMLAA